MPSNPRPSLRELFASFLRLGATSFGGPSMVVYIRKLTVEKKQWLDTEVFGAGVALCQMIPGATAMQAAAYVGLKTRGVPGAAASFVGFGLPAFVLMMVLAAVYTRTRDLALVVSVFGGLQAIIVAIIANAALSFGRAILKKWSAAAVALAAAAMFGLKVNPILVILLSGAAGFAMSGPNPPDSRGSQSPQHGRRNTKPLLFILFGSATGLLLLYFFDRALFHLAALTLRIDLFAFGGAYASVPLMLHEIVEVRHWIDRHTFMNGIVIGQVTPGPIVLTATFIGFLLGGPLGGVVATIGILLPSFVVLVGVSPFYDRLRTSPSFNKVIGGVLCSFVGLLVTVAVRFALDVHWDPFHSLLAGGALAALLMRIDILWVVLAGTIISAAAFA
jgi:chromate transporter